MRKETQAMFQTKIDTNSGSRRGALAQLADLAYRRRGRVIAAWIAALAAVIALGAQVGGTYHADYTTPGSDSAAAATLIERGFRTGAPDTIDVVWRSQHGAADPAARARVDRFLAQASRLKGIAGSLPTRISADGRIAISSLQLDRKPWDVPVSTGKRLIAQARAASGNGLQIELAGGPITSAEGGQSPQGVGFFVAAIVLLIAFGSLVAAGLPLATALFGLGISSSLILVLAFAIDVPDWAPAVAGLIGIGVGIDYALLVLTRFRFALSQGNDPRQAVVEAVSTAGRSVLLAGSTVVISLLGLFLVGVSYLHGVALSASLAVLVVMLAAVTLLPALLAIAGRRVDRLRIPGLHRGPRLEEAAPAARWARLIQRHPWSALFAGAAVLLALAAPALGMRLGFPDAGNDPAGTTTRKAFDLARTGFGPGANGTLLIAAQLRQAGEAAPLERAAQELRGSADVSFVSPPRFDRSGRIAEIAVAPAASPQSKATEDLVHRLRESTLPQALTGSGITAHVGGTTAAFVDQASYVRARLPVFIAGVVLLSFLLLLLAFRSPLLAAKAAFMNLLSVGAAYGVITLFAKGGGLGGLIGIDHETPVAPFIPVMMFAILFGLSMDYEVFLLSRVREEFLDRGRTDLAVTAGLARTARVITAAAAIMVVVFLAFVVSNTAFLKLLGIGMATAILVDATVVRMVLVPAVMQLLGRANWWLPHWLDRILPRLDPEPARAGAR
jgi:RND superfamily putative drug exporter